MWNFPGPGMESGSPALAGGFITNGGAGKSYKMLFKRTWRKFLYRLWDKARKDPVKAVLLPTVSSSWHPPCRGRIQYRTRSLIHFNDPSLYFLEKAMAPHSSTLAWKIRWMEEPGRLQSMGSLRVRHNWATSLSLFTFMHWRRKWQPTPVFLPGESQGRVSLVGWRLWGHTELGTTEVT